MSTGVITSLSDKGWVKLLIESVDVPVESDDSLVFSTVQSLIPGAHGLYFRDNGQRKALNLDTGTGRIQVPNGGWTAQDIYVHIAHGHRHGANCGVNGEYTKASEIFERNVSAVQKLIASAGLGYGGLKKSDAKNSPKRSSRMKSGFEAQPEEVHISDESDSYLHQQMEQKQKEVDKITSEREELVLRLKDVESELNDQKKENERLKSSLEEAKAEPEAQVIEQVQVTSSEKKKKGKKGKEVAPGRDPKDVVIEQLHDDIQKANHRITELQAEVATLKATKVPGPSMDESGFLEETEEKHQQHVEEVDAIQKKLDAANNKIQELIEKEEEMNNLHNVIAELRNKLAVLTKEKSEVEGHLGEHKEWLKNSHDKMTYLELELQRGGPSEDKVKELEADKNRQAEEIWLAHEKIAHLDDTITKQQLQITDANEKLREASHREDVIQSINEEKEKLQWKVGELTQWWNDAKWRIGELEAEIEEQKKKIEKANENILRLLNEEPISISPKAQSELPAVPTLFSVSKPNGSPRWQLASTSGHDHQMPVPMIAQPMYAPQPMAYPAYYPQAYPAPVPFMPTTVAQPTETRRVLFEIDAPNARTVFLAGSFLNWEVALLCKPTPNGGQGVWVDLPRGHHDFKFLVDGEWRSSSHYPASTNEFGSANNQRFVE